MPRPYIKGGMPIGSDSLCKTCSYAQIMSGFRESELLTICHNPDPYLTVPFNIYECTRYYDKNRPSYNQMQKLAIHVEPKTLKPAGFRTGLGFQESVKVTVGTTDEDEDDEYDD